MENTTQKNRKVEDITNQETEKVKLPLVTTEINLSQEGAEKMATKVMNTAGLEDAGAIAQILRDYSKLAKAGREDRYVSKGSRQYLALREEVISEMNAEQEAKSKDFDKMEEMEGQEIWTNAFSKRFEERVCVLVEKGNCWNKGKKFKPTKEEVNALWDDMIESEIGSKEQREADLKAEFTPEVCKKYFEEEVEERIKKKLNQKECDNCEERTDDLEKFKSKMLCPECLDGHRCDVMHNDIYGGEQ